MANTGVEVMDAPRFLQAMATYLDLLGENEQLINDLNVYPVPDSDTGTNSLGTMQAGLSNLDLANSDPGAMDLAQVAGLVAAGASTAARGNSGVILAEYLSGLANAVNNQATSAQWAQALSAGSTSARAAVLTPAEGTMLTVADAACEVTPDKDFAIYYSNIQIAVRNALARTQELLPELRAAKVVDAGGVVIALLHEAFAIALGVRGSSLEIIPRSQNLVSTYAGPEFEVMFVAKCDESNRKLLETQLQTLGESIAITGATPNLTFHIHCDDPQAVLLHSEKIAEISDFRIENLGT